MAQKTSQSLSPRGRFWRRHIQQWQRSGATQSQYCREHDLSIAAFHWWRRKLTCRHPRVGPRRGAPTEPVTTFTEIRLPEGDAVAAAAYAYEILLPNRTHLRLRKDFDPEAVAALVCRLRDSC
jgi:transposase-like protein